jgi:hypothetical protein
MLFWRRVISGEEMMTRMAIRAHVGSMAEMIKAAGVQPE